MGPEGSFGATTLTARALGRHGAVYSEDTVEVGGGLEGGSLHCTIQ